MSPILGGNKIKTGYARLGERGGGVCKCFQFFLPLSYGRRLILNIMYYYSNIYMCNFLTMSTKRSLCK